MTLEKKGLNFLVVLVVSLLVFSSSVSALIGNIGNARMILYPEVDGKATVTIDKSINVKNVNDVQVNITLKLDEEAEKFIELIDKTFVLEPGTEKKAAFKINVKKEGTYQGKIIVYFSPVEGKETGVALPATVVVIAKKDQGYVDEEDNTDANNNNDQGPITGEVTGEENKKLNPVIYLAAMTGVLLLVLVFLISIMANKRKRRNGNGSKKNGK